MRRAALLLVLAPACADVLELEDRRDVIAALCACTEEVPQFDGECVAILSHRLDTSLDGTRAAWLDHFVNLCGGADGVCPHAYECYAQPGTCSPLACASDEECCGFLEGTRCGSAGLCESAAAPGGAR